MGHSERLTFPEPSSTPPPSGSGTRPERVLERRHPDPHRAKARKPSLSPRSLRAQDRSRGAPTHDSPQAPAQPPNHQAAAGPGRSEHRNVDTLIPIARQRESSAGPNVPCERRTDPAEPRRGTDPQRQPRHSATAKQVRAPGCMRRSFRTLRLCAIPGVSPRAGMRCPVGALRTPHLLQSVPAQDRTTKQQRDRAGASIGTSAP